MTRTVLLLSLVGSVSGLAVDFGAKTVTEYPPGVSRSIRQYNSCVLSIDQLAGALGALTLPAGFVPTTVADLKSRNTTTTFGSETLQLFVLEGIRPSDLALARIPRQSFLLSSTESRHKTFQSMATFEGYYLLYPRVGRSEEVLRFVDGHFAKIRFARRSGDLASGEYALIPVNQYASFLEIQSGVRSATTWEFRAAPASTTTPFVPPQAVRPGVLRTGRGTYYVFNAGGSIDVYRRNGDLVVHTPAPTPARGEPSYASHRAILARQGVQIDTNDPVRAIEIALERNGGVIDEHRRRNAIPESTVGIIAHDLAVAERGYAGTANERWRAITRGAEAGDRMAATLPPFLRWFRPNDPSLQTAPLDATGDIASLRTIRPFLFLRAPAGATGWSPEVRMISDDCIHLQALHAAMGRLGLRAEEDGLVGGGHLAYEYSPDTRRLIRIRLEGNGLNSLAHARGQQLFLSDREVTALGEALRNGLPWEWRREVEIVLTAPPT